MCSAENQSDNMMARDGSISDMALATWSRNPIPAGDVTNLVSFTRHPRVHGSAVGGGGDIMVPGGAGDGGGGAFSQHGATPDAGSSSRTLEYI